MRQFKAFTFYYILPFGIYILFAALQSSSQARFWGMLALGAFFAFMGLFLMKNALDSEVVATPVVLAPVQQREEEVPAPVPQPTMIIDMAKEREWGEKLHSKDEEILSLKQQLAALQTEVTQTDEQLKVREAAIQELRFEVRSLLAISRSKSSPAAS